MADTQVVVPNGMVIAAGTTAIAPILLTAGTDLTNAAAGAVEYDGKVLHFTPNTSNRAVSKSVHYGNLAAAQTGQNVNTVQPWLVGAPFTAGNITLPAGTLYKFEGELILSRTAGTTSHTTGILFGGTATITSIAYTTDVNTNNTSLATLAAATTNRVGVATLNTLTAANTSATEQIQIRVKGTVRINAGGTFIPQFQYSAAPGGAPTIGIGTFFELIPLGANTDVSAGNWA